ncbi:MAG: heavy-metal-associated domain-containing protein [Phycisphaeraceae bacterium]|nr:heavy-metal-associated domain-containing protein [Phycisphaeraceae bacterium]
MARPATSPVVSAGAVLVLFAALGSALAGCDGKDPAPAARVATTTIEIPVYGMDCDGCASSVRSKIMRVPGVVECTVSHTEHRAVCTVEESVDRELLAEAIRRAGYFLEPPDGDHDHGHADDHGDGDGGATSDHGH